jgi:hypothetical protein
LRSLAESLAALDADAIRAQYNEYNQLFWQDSVLPADLVARLAEEALALRPRAHRVRVPGYKKSGSVSAFQLRESAPSIAALYEDPALIRFLSSVAGIGVDSAFMPCPEEDPHAFGLYYYTEPGDRIGFHYDTSHYAGTRYTVLIGLVNRSTSELVCHPFRRRNGPPLELRVATQPGTLVFFNGNNIWHSVSPVGEDEERIVLTLEYVTNPAMSPFRRAISNLKDAMTYFGFSEVMRSRTKKAT